MAFEYYIAYHLLSRRMDRFIQMIPEIIERRAENLPRHVEEALILVGMTGIAQDLDMSEIQLRKDYVDNFHDFLAIIAKHKNNTQYAQIDLVEKYSDTYWYYHLYHQAREL